MPILREADPMAERAGGPLPGGGGTDTVAKGSGRRAASDHVHQHGRHPAGMRGDRRSPRGGICPQIPLCRMPQTGQQAEKERHKTGDAVRNTTPHSSAALPPSPQGEGKK